MVLGHLKVHANHSDMHEIASELSREISYKFQETVGSIDLEIVVDEETGDVVVQSIGGTSLEQRVKL